MVEVMVMAMAEAEQQIGLVKLEGRPTVVEDAREDEDIVPIYLYYYQNQILFKKSYTYRSRHWSGSMNWSRSRNWGRRSSTASHGHQLWKSGILFSEIKRKVIILCLDMIYYSKGCQMFNRKIKLTGSGLGTGILN